MLLKLRVTQSPKSCEFPFLVTAKVFTGPGVGDNAGEAGRAKPRARDGIPPPNPKAKRVPRPDRHGETADQARARMVHEARRARAAAAANHQHSHLPSEAQFGGRVPQPAQPRRKQTFSFVHDPRGNPSHPPRDGRPPYRLSEAGPSTFTKWNRIRRHQPRRAHGSSNHDTEESTDDSSDSDAESVAKSGSDAGCGSRDSRSESAEDDTSSDSRDSSTAPQPKRKSKGTGKGRTRGKSPPPKYNTIEDPAPLNHYAVLGLKETATAEESVIIFGDHGGEVANIDSGSRRRQNKCE